MWHILRRESEGCREGGGTNPSFDIENTAAALGCIIVDITKVLDVLLGHLIILISRPIFLFWEWNGVAMYDS